MDENQIHAFIKSAQYGSFSKAAEDLFISAPAVVKQMNSLEKEVGFSLFVRTNHGVFLTDAGKSFLNDMESIETEIRAAIYRASRISMETPLEITIGVSALAPGTSLIAQFNTIRQIEPSLHFNIADYRNDMQQAGGLLSHLGENGIDIVQAFYDDHLLKATGCQALKMKDMNICLAVPASHVLAGKQMIRMEDLDGQTVLVPAHGIFEPMDIVSENLKENHPAVIQKIFNAYDVTIFNRCVNENILLLAVEDWRSVHPLVKIIPADWDYTIPFGILYRSHQNEALQRFIRAMKKIQEINKPAGKQS